MSTEKIQTPLRLEKDLRNRLQMMAKSQNRSLQNFIETILQREAKIPNEETVRAIEDKESFEFSSFRNLIED